MYWPMTEQQVSSITLLVLHAVSSHLVPHQQEVSDSDAARQGTLIISHFMTIKQYVSDTALLLPLAEQSHDQLSHPRTIRRWVTLHYFFYQTDIMTNRVWVTLIFFNMSHFPWSTSSACEWHCIFYFARNLLTSYATTNRWWVTSIHTLPGRLMSHAWAITNSMWVIFHILFCQQSLIMSHPMTTSGWVTLHFDSPSIITHCVSSHYQQGASNTAFYFFA